MLASDRDCRSLLDRLSLPVYRRRDDEDLSYDYLNAAGWALFGVSPGGGCEATAPGLSRMHPQDRAPIAGALRAALAELRSYALAYRIVCEDGTCAWVRDEGRAVLREDGSRCLEGSLTDLARERSADVALAASEARLRRVIEAAPVVVWTTDGAGMVTMVLGQKRTEGELIGRSVDAVFGDYPALVENHRRALAGETFAEQVEYRGAIFDARYAPLRDADGALNGMIGVAVDITIREQAVQDLRHSEELNRRIIEAVPSGIVLVSADGAILRANQTAQRLLGLTYQELTARCIADFGAETVREDGSPYPVEEYPVSRCLATREAQPPATLGVRRKAGGEIFWGVYAAIPLFDPLTAQFLGAVVTFVDITERKRHEDAEQRLRAELWQAQKLEAMGRLAGGIAHDFNNLLAGILGHASLIKERVNPGSEVQQAAETIELAADRGRSLTRQLLGFARKGKYQDTPFELNRIVADTLVLLERTIEKRIRLVHEPPVGPATMRGDPGQIQQVLINLALNARDAMPEGGELRIAVTAVDLEGGAEEGGDPAARRHLKLTVADTGTGIPPEVRPHIFDPFFTTKAVGAGTGMGLAVVDGIVRNHGGCITVDSAPGAGTTFAIYFPAPAETLPEPPCARPVKGSHTLCGRVLVVDDEDLVRRSAQAQLERLGHEVVSAGSAEEAIRAYQSAPARFDAVLLDMNMPNVDGAACFQDLKRIDPDVAVVLTTGFGQNEVVRRILSEGGRGFLEKPYRMAELAEAIQKIIEVDRSR